MGDLVEKSELCLAAVSMTTGSAATDAVATIRARGAIPIRRAASPSPTSTSAAASAKLGEFPRV